MIDSNADLRLHRRFDAFGNIVEQTHYDTSGSTISSTDPEYVDIVFAFTDKYFDKDNGLQNNHHRWYDPKIGRWISEAPIVFDEG